MMEWQPIETAPKDETHHVRGLFVHNNKTKRSYWESIAGHLDEDGEFVDHDGNSPWRADDYEYWHALAEPPTPSHSFS
jgi:hypothetical protein